MKGTLCLHIHQFGTQAVQRCSEWMPLTDDLDEDDKPSTTGTSDVVLTE